MHRVLWLVLLGGVVLGAGAGWWAHAVALGQGSAWSLAAATLVLAVLGTPLLWAASAVLSRPLMRLAGVATRLREGQLAHREALRAAGDHDLDDVSEALGGLADRVSQQLDDQKALLAAVSHELRSPLGRLRVMVELQREGLAGTDVLDRIQEEIDGMDALVGDLLAGARIDFAAVAPQQLPVRDLVDRAMSEARVELPVEVPAGSSVRADPTLAVRALAGLLDNARVHGGGAVSLQVACVDDAVRFEVDDDGPGFAPGEEEMAFQPFWRRPGQVGGTGLGLALVRQIARVHEGAAFAAARPEGGGRVTLELPVYRQVLMTFGP